jgi:branched-chain amino acid transport system substrate-binding protein
MTATRKDNPPPIVYILTGAALLSCVYGLRFCGATPDSIINSGASQERVSFGERVLIDADATPQKKLGVQAFSDGNYGEAITDFSASLKRYPNDPESLIYLNNAVIRNADSAVIAVSVPISSNLNVSQEILRGVAQVQQNVNRSGGIKGVLLKVKIIDDRNDPSTAKQVATDLVHDKQVLAVVGHNASDATLAAAPIYEQGGLVMISPTSNSNKLSRFGNFIFRTVPTIRFLADPLAAYVVKTAHKNRIAVCFDNQSPDNLDFKDEFIASLKGYRAKFIDTECDFSSPTFNPETAVAQAITKGADGILLAPHIDRLDRAIDLTHAVKGKLALFSSSTLYTFKTIQSGLQDVNGLVLPVPWHPSVSANNPFLAGAHQLWKGEINWRTATALDATQAIVDGLKRSNSRKDLQRVLRSPNFVSKGIAGDIRFLPTGDRASTPILIKVQPDAKSSTGYSFTPLTR